MVLFCDDCGSVMHGDRGETVCSSYETTALRDENTAEEQGGGDLTETEEGANVEGKPTPEDVTCGDCDHGVTWYTAKQTGSADELPTRLLDCRYGMSVRNPRSNVRTRAPV